MLIVRSHFDLLLSQVSVLSALAGAHVPLEAREHTGKSSSIASLSLLPNPALASVDMQYLVAVEHGRAVARDIGGSDPERMAAPKIVAYLEHVLKGTAVNMRVDSDTTTINNEYPLLAGS